MAESWLDYLRQLDRMTWDDHAIEGRARAFHWAMHPRPSPLDRRAPRLARRNEERGTEAPASCDQ